MVLNYSKSNAKFFLRECSSCVEGSNLNNVLLCKFRCSRTFSAGGCFWVHVPSIQLPIAPAFWMCIGSIPKAAWGSLWMYAEPLSIALGCSSFCVSIFGIICGTSGTKMFIANAWRKIAGVKRAVWRGVDPILEKVSNAMRPQMMRPFSHFYGELPVPVLVLPARPSPTVPFWTLPWRLIDLAPEAGDVLLGKGRHGFGFVERFAFWFRLSLGHVSDLLDRSLDGLRGVASTSQPSPILPQQLKGFA